MSLGIGEYVLCSARGGLLTAMQEGSRTGRLNMSRQSIDGTPQASRSCSRWSDVDSDGGTDAASRMVSVSLVHSDLYGRGEEFLSLPLLKQYLYCRGMSGAFLLSFSRSHHRDSHTLLYQLLSLPTSSPPRFLLPRLSAQSASLARPAQDPFFRRQRLPPCRLSSQHSCPHPLSPKKFRRLHRKSLSQPLSIASSSLKTPPSHPHSTMTTLLAEA